MSEQNYCETNFCIWLTERMKSKGINQKELAELTNSTTALVSKWATGKFPPSFEKMNKIAKALDCTVAFIPNEKMETFETAYFDGFEYGRQTTLKDIIKMLKEVEWYGGDKQAKRADRMPGDHAGRAADMQQELERTGTKGRHGRSVAAMPAED